MACTAVTHAVRLLKPARRWAFVEVTDPWDAKNTIQAALILKWALFEAIK